MQVELTAETMAAMQTLLQSGNYDSRQERVEVAIANLLRAEPNHARLRKLVQGGVDSAQNEPLITKDQFLQHPAERQLKRA